MTGFRPRRARQPAAIYLLLGCCLWLPGCTVPPFLAPVIEVTSVTSLDVVDWRRSREARRGTGDLPPLPILKVSFTTRQNLRSYTSRYDVQIAVRASLCRDSAYDPAREIDTSISVYDRFDDVDNFGRPVPEEQQHETEAYFYLDIVTRGQGYTNAPRTDWAVGHDLRRDAADICFQIRTGIMMIPGTRSETVVLPYATIRAALDRAGL